MIKASLKFVEIQEIKKIFQENSLYKFFTSSEIPNPIRKTSFTNLAGKLAGKKSFLDAIGENVKFNELEIINISSGRPKIKILNPKLKNKINLNKISISISHTKFLAVAVCVIYE